MMEFVSPLSRIENCLERLYLKLFSVEKFPPERGREEGGVGGSLGSDADRLLLFHQRFSINQEFFLLSLFRLNVSGEFVFFSLETFAMSLDFRLISSPSMA